MIHIRKSFCIFFIVVVPVLGSDHKNTSEAESIQLSDHAIIPYTPDELQFYRSQLALLVGDPIARKTSTIRVAKRVCEMYKSIFELPADIQRLIVTNSIFYEVYQRLYLKSFNMVGGMITQKNMHQMTSLSSLGEDAVAVAQPESFIEVWSLRDRKKIFTSSQLASAANYYCYPLLMSGSPGTSLYTWNTKDNYKHTTVKTDHSVHINLLFVGGDSCAVSCDLNGVFCVHDSETLNTKLTVSDAHDGLIYAGKRVSPHTFLTTGDDCYIKEWDVLLGKSISAYKCHPNFIPYGIHSINERYIIVGGSQRKVYILDRRMNNLALKEEFDKSMTLDMTALSDDTVVFGDRAVCFETWDGNMLTQQMRLPIDSSLFSVVANQNDTVVYADKDSKIFSIKPIGKPYHLTQNLSLEQCIMATSIDTESFDS